MIKDYILPNKDCLGAMEPEDFVCESSGHHHHHLLERVFLHSCSVSVLFEILQTELNQTSSESKNLIISSSFALLVKFGPLLAFPANFLREQSAFFTKLGQTVTPNDPRILQEDVIDCIQNFCQYVSVSLLDFPELRALTCRQPKTIGYRASNWGRKCFRC